MQIAICPPPLTEPAGNAVSSMPTVKMMGTAQYTTAGYSIVAFPTERRQGQARKRVAGLSPPVQNPGTVSIIL